MDLFPALQGLNPPFAFTDLSQQSSENDMVDLVLNSGWFYNSDQGPEIGFQRSLLYFGRRFIVAHKYGMATIISSKR